MGARRADWGTFNRRGEAVEEGAWWPAVRRASRRPLMAFGLIGASRSGGAIRGSSTGDGTARAEAERRAGIPDAWCVWGRTVACACSAWAGAVREQGGEKRREGGLGFGFGLISCFGFGLGPLFLFYSISKTNKHV